MALIGESASSVHVLVELPVPTSTTGAAQLTRLKLQVQVLHRWRGRSRRFHVLQPAEPDCHDPDLGGSTHPEDCKAAGGGQGRSDSEQHHPCSWRQVTRLTAVVMGTCGAGITLECAHAQDSRVTHLPCVQLPFKPRWAACKADAVPGRLLPRGLWRRRSRVSAHLSYTPAADAICQCNVSLKLYSDCGYACECRRCG